MKRRVWISARAEADLTNQYRWYCDNAKVETAERFLRAFDDRQELLSKFPELGRLRKFRAIELRGIRSLSISDTFSNHLIFYSSNENTVSVERVMHGSRDLEQRLLERPE